MVFGLCCLTKVIGHSDRAYRREKNPIWLEGSCAENNTHVNIGDQDYVKSWDGLLMPARKDQPPPDLRYFKQTVS